MNINWDVKGYSDNFSFVHEYGEDVLGLITAQSGGFAVDLGCGNGALSKKLCDRGYDVLGIDASADMIAAAKKMNPDINFMVADAADFTLDKKADVIFSNAVLHWIDADKQENVISNISEQLKTGGQFVCEFGGKGCGEAVHKALENSFEKRGLVYERIFYFPTIGEYTPLLEKYGLRVVYASLFNRPTEQKGDNGLENWIKMFVKKPFENLDNDVENAIIAESVEALKNTLYKNGKWFVDYVRIRIKAKKAI